MCGQITEHFDILKSRCSCADLYFPILTGGDRPAFGHPQHQIT